MFHVEILMQPVRHSPRYRQCKPTTTRWFLHCALAIGTCKLACNVQILNVSQITTRGTPPHIRLDVSLLACISSPPPASDARAKVRTFLAPFYNGTGGLKRCSIDQVPKVRLSISMRPQEKWRRTWQEKVTPRLYELSHISRSEILGNAPSTSRNYYISPLSHVAGLIPCLIRRYQAESHCGHGHCKCRTFLLYTCRCPLLASLNQNYHTL